MPPTRPSSASCPGSTPHRWRPGPVTPQPTGRRRRRPDRCRRPTDDMFTIEELAAETGVPLALLKAVEAEGLLIPRRVGGQRALHHRGRGRGPRRPPPPRVGHPAVGPARSGPPPPRGHPGGGPGGGDPVLDLRATAAAGTSRPRPTDRHGRRRTTPTSTGWSRPTAELLPAVNTLVANHFTRTLVNTALDHVEQVGSDAERQAISDQIAAAGRSSPSRPTPTSVRRGDPSAPAPARPSPAVGVGGGGPTPSSRPARRRP